MPRKDKESGRVAPPMAEELRMALPRSNFGAALEGLKLAKNSNHDNIDHSKNLHVCIFEGMAGHIAPHLQPCLKVACSNALVAPSGSSPACEPAKPASEPACQPERGKFAAKLCQNCKPSTPLVGDLSHPWAI